MNFFSTQNPGIGGIDELTPSEEIFVMNLSSLPYQQGDIIYHNGISLTRLPAGVSGQYLQTQGVGANPIWATVSGGGGGSVSLAEVEIDFGTITAPITSWTIIDPSIVSSNKILVFPSPNPATGRKGNDWELDSAIFTAIAGTGSFVLYANTQSKIIEKRKIYYQII